MIIFFIYYLKYKLFLVYYLLGGSMDSKMDKLLKKLKLSDECIKMFENSKLEKIVSNKEKTNYCFYIKIENTLEPELYKEFEKNLKKSFNKVENVNVVFNVENMNQGLIKDYLKLIIEDYSKKSSMLSIFLDNKIEVENNIINFYINNTDRRI